MPTLTIYLREGFFHTPVVICIDGRERFRSESVTTRMQIGLGKMVPIDVPEGKADVEIRFPSLSRSIRKTIDVRAEKHVAVDLDQSGLASVKVQQEPFHFM